MKSQGSKTIFRFSSENGGCNASLFLFAGIAAEIALLIDILCVIVVTGGLEYGFDPLGTGCITGAGCILLLVLCGILLSREEQMMYFIISAVITAAAAAAMLIFRSSVLDFWQQAMISVEMMDTDFTSAPEVQ